MFWLPMGSATFLWTYRNTPRYSRGETVMSVRSRLTNCYWKCCLPTTPAQAGAVDHYWCDISQGVCCWGNHSAQEKHKQHYDNRVTWDTYSYLGGWLGPSALYASWNWCQAETLKAMAWSVESRVSVYFHKISQSVLTNYVWSCSQGTFFCWCGGRRWGPGRPPR